ncbi:MAG TPA: NTP transferase domain-containing protein [Methylomirabilota bacterium]|nr:NTP transferase domain-containing protein [Methylomirabilota bacterium]
MTDRRFVAVVLAGDRRPGDPVARAGGVSAKCLVRIGGRPMVLRVLDALGSAGEIGARVLCGPDRKVLDDAPELARCLADQEVDWLPPQATPTRSAAAAVASVASGSPVLLTTADHALLTARLVDHFCARARATAADVVVGVADHAEVLAAFPGTRRTVLRLRDGGYCGCNLFAFLTPAGRAAIDFWRRVEQERKQPLRLAAGVLGWRGLARFALGRLTLDDALSLASRRVGARISAVRLPFPEAAVDVDTVEDLRLVTAVSDGPDG